MPDKPIIERVLQALTSSWSAETSYLPGEWSEQNPARGHCVVSALIVQDYFGGDLERVKVTGPHMDETHYYNRLPGGTMLDATRSQYDAVITDMSMKVRPVDYAAEGFASVRERCLSDDDTRRRYELLSEVVRATLLR